MNLNDLRAFLAVADAASFSLAAEQLHITQPAVSKRVRNLEQAFEVQLFDRVGKRVYLTEAGHLLMPQAQRMIATLVDTEKKIADLGNSVSGQLSLATSHHIGLHRLAPALRAFNQAYPKVQLNISFEDSEVAHEMVRQGDIELAVVTLNPAGETQLSSEPVWDDPLVFVQDKATQKKLSMAELAKHPCVLPGTTTFTGRIVLERFADVGIQLNPSMSTNYLETIGMLVSVGLGWSVLPKSMAGELAILDVDCPTMTRSLGWITNPARTMSNAGRAFVSVLEQFGDRSS